MVHLSCESNLGLCMCSQLLGLPHSRWFWAALPIWKLHHAAVPVLDMICQMKSAVRISVTSVHIKFKVCERRRQDKVLHLYTLSVLGVEKL